MQNKPAKSVEAPPTFRDAKNRDWTIKLNLDLLDTVLERTKVDLAPDNNDPSEITGLLFSRKKLGAVLWEICQEQAESKSVDRKSFMAGFDGDALLNGWRALVDGILFFIQLSTGSVELANQFGELIEANMKVVEAGAKQIVKTLQSQETAAAIQQAVEVIGNDLQSETNEALAKSVGTSRESSASIRGRFRSGT